MENIQFSVFQDERFMDLTLYQYGCEKCEPLHSFGPFVRNHYLFHYIISGKGILYADDAQHNTSIYELSAGSGFLIEPGFSNLYSADERDPWEYIWLEFGGLRAKELLETAGIAYSHPVYQPTSPDQGQKLLEQMYCIVREPDSSALRQIGHLYLFMDLLTSSSSSRKQLQGGRLSEFYVRETISFIEQYYTQNITVLDMAKRCNLDRSYFGKVFREIVGRSPQEFLIQFRMSKAAEALTLTNKSIGDIASSVGYQNPLHFSQAFKNVYRVSPREYRQKNLILEREI